MIDELLVLLVAALAIGVMLMIWQPWDKKPPTKPPSR
jgi:hypothetical protein